ncbi:endoribonuclease [Bryobacterales bacterium F-183]|nr:endoribonuclease [Bryobacterales bacterium F-183]
MLERIYPPGVVAPRGPYTPAIKAGGFIYVSGQVPIDPQTNQFIESDIRTETLRTLENIEMVLKGAEASRTDIVKCSVFLKDGKDFAAMNEAYTQFFGDHKPARTTVEVKFASPNMLVEIDAVAYKP